MISNFAGNTTQNVVALVTGNGSGTKLFQALLDNHEQICMIPAYPLIYLYPHWEHASYYRAWKMQHVNLLLLIQQIK